MHARNEARLRLAQARVGAVHLGIPADSVVQAIPVPDSLSLLPLRGKALRGVIDHGGVLVPVVDLARWVDVGSAVPSPGDAQRILVLSEGGRTIGLLVDALAGLAEPDAAGARRLHHGDDPDDVFHSAVQAPDGPILCLLEVGRLAELALAWSAALPAASAHAPAAGGEPDAPTDAPTDAASLVALLDTGHGLLGVAPAHLAEVIPMPALEQLGGGAWCGWRGRHLAVLPCAALMGGQADGADDGAAPLLAVLAHEGLALGLPVRGVLQLRAAPPGLALADGLTATAFDADGSEIRLLDTASLFARYPEAALSRQDGLAASASADHAADAANAGAYIVFEAAGMQAVPIAAVEQILALADGAGTSMPWRGAAIPLVDLRAPGPARAAAGHVLVAQGARGPAAYVVTRVRSLIPAGAGRLYRMGAGRRTEFIMAGEGTEQASYKIVELAARA
jgi:chemotaxis signal transduction protein